MNDAQFSESEVKEDIASLTAYPVATDIHIVERVRSSRNRSAMTYLRPQPSSGKGHSGYLEPEYDLEEIGAAEDTDSYVYQANFKKIALAMRRGFSFTGRNPKTVEYIKARIKQIEKAQGQSWGAFIEELFNNLFKYHTVDIVKSRSKSESGGKPRVVGKKICDPVAAYYIASPNTMKPRLGSDYRVKKWKHEMPDGRYRFISGQDVTRITINKKSHFLMGTPPWIPVIDDIAALRRIEEHVENLVYQFIYPLYAYKVGTPDRPVELYEDGSSELDRVKSRVGNMSSDGMLVIPDRHEIKGLGSESRALRAEVYVEYFKKRVVVGTGMSQLDFGDGETANRATADSMSKLAMGNVNFVQQALARELNFGLIQELLLESTFNFDVLDEENIVEIQFNEIDLEAQIKLQNHYLLLYQANMITFEEARKFCGWDALPAEKEPGLHLNTIDKIKQERIAASALAVAKVGGEDSSDSSADATAAAAAATAKTKQQPTNQHGTNSGPTKAKSAALRETASTEEYDALISDLKSMGEREVSIGKVGEKFIAASSRVKRRAASRIGAAVLSGTKGFVVDKKLQDKMEEISSETRQSFEEDVDRLFRDVSKKTIIELANGEQDSLTIETLKYRMDDIEKIALRKAKILSQVESMKMNGETLAIIKCDPQGKDYSTHDGIVIDLSSVTSDMLPPFHTNCSCRLDFAGDQNG